MIRLLRKLLFLVVLLVAVWIGLLLAGGALAGRWLQDNALDAWERDLGVTTRIREADVGLVLGRVVVSDIAATRESGGALRLTVDEVVAEVPPLGLVALQRDRLDSLAISGVKLALSSWAFLAPPPGGGVRLHIGRVSLRDVEVRVAPTLLLPNVGAIVLVIEQATSGPVVLRSASSWLLGLESLDAKATFPGGATVGVRFRAAQDGGGTLTLSSDLLGGDLAVPITLPPRSSITGAAEEVKALAELVAQIRREITKRKAAQVWERLTR